MGGDGIERPVRAEREWRGLPESGSGEGDAPSSPLDVATGEVAAADFTWCTGQAPGEPVTGDTTDPLTTMDVTAGTFVEVFPDDPRPATSNDQNLWMALGGVT